MSKDIKIFVSHRIDLKSEIIDNPLYVNVRCGAVYDNRGNVTMLGDDTGDNISEKRESFCELTVQYWAWKNVEADYYGLCHYRRYLSFADKRYETANEERNNGCVDEDYLTNALIKKHNLNELDMRRIIEKYDVLACEPINIDKSNYEAMEASYDYHNIDDVDMMLDIIKEYYPNMYKIARNYMDGNVCRLYMCYIMKKEIFHEYCEWMFKILFELEKRINMKQYGVKKYRTPGTIGERLFGIYCMYLIEEKNIKFKNMQLMFLEHTEKNNELKPVDKNQITIVSNFNNQYATVFMVAMQSIVEQIDANNIYQFIILSEDITDYNKTIMLDMIKKHKNVSLLFYNPFAILSDINLFVNNSVYSKDLYVRCIIPYILKNYNKCLVLDADIIVKEDVYNLYKTDISDYMMGAVKDVVYQGYLNGAMENYIQYTRDTLGLEEPYDYCNTGVILLNCKKIRDAYSLQYIKDYINTHRFKIYEQDILNVLFEGKIKFIDVKWNVPTYTNDFVKNAISLAPINSYKQYIKARKNPKIIHFASHPKPWWMKESDFGYAFWDVARRTPGYEYLLGTMSWMIANQLECDSRGKSDWIQVHMGGDLYSRFIFPWKIVKPGARIIIYGGGIVGKTFLKQVSNNPYCHIITIVDKNPESTGIVEAPVIGINELAEIDCSTYDVILIALERKDLAVIVRSDLELMGIPSSKIKWVDPTRR